MAKVGTLVDGKYEILREIGRGGMSVVYLAMDTRLNKQWAIKEIARKANDANNDIVVSSLLAEANLMKKLDHPALPRIVDIIEEQNTIYVVMDYIEGEPLSKVLEVYGAQDQDTVIEWGKQLCDVLFYLHNCEPPIIYRDMKPANIMLRPDGSVKLIDFGIAREYKRSKTADTESLGTRGYAAPEQFGGKGQTDARTDIYSFGVTLYHLVTGKNPCEPPYELYPIKQINPSFYDGLQYLIQKCTQMNPEDRFQSCDEIRYVLDNIHEFDKGRRLNQNKKYKAFITMTILTIVFAILGGGSLGLGRAALNRDFKENLQIIATQDEIDKVRESYNNMKNQSGVSDLNKLQLMATYYEALDRISKTDTSLIASESLSTPLEYISTDYAALSSDERTYFALSCYYLGRIYFKQNSSSNASSFTEAEKYFAYIVETDKLNLLSDEHYEYDTSLLTDEILSNAQALYYLSSAYGYYFKTADQSSSVSMGEDTDGSASLTAKEAFDRMIKSTDILSKDIGASMKISMYKAYYNALKNSNVLVLFKNAGITADEVNQLYSAIYAEDYDDVCKQAVNQFGTVEITAAQEETLNSKVANTTAVYSADLGIDDTLVAIKADRFEVAHTIYNLYK